MRDYLREPVILIFWLIGAAFLLSGLVVGWQTYQVSNWPTVSAKVINSQVIKDSDGKYVGQVEFEVADAPHVYANHGRHVTRFTMTVLEPLARVRP